MAVSSKCYYALRAIYALSEHPGPDPLKIAEIAEREQIPVRFLEVILGQLKGGGFVRSRRGAEGGYNLARSPSNRYAQIAPCCRPVSPSSTFGKGDFPSGQNDGMRVPG